MKTGRPGRLSSGTVDGGLEAGGVSDAHGEQDQQACGKTGG